MPYKDKEKAREYDRNWRKKKRLEYKNKGLCIKCGQPSVENHVHCLLHLSRFHIEWRKNKKNLKIIMRRKEHRKEQYYQRKSENKCVDCGMPLSIESRMGIRCLNCYSKLRGYI